MTPPMIVKSMPGAGNVLATNFMYNAAPKDGTHIATINNSIPLHQVINGRGVQYDATKFNWLTVPALPAVRLLALLSCSSWGGSGPWCSRS